MRTNYSRIARAQLYEDGLQLEPSEGISKFQKQSYASFKLVRIPPYRLSETLFISVNMIFVRADVPGLLKMYMIGRNQLVWGTLSFHYKVNVLA